MPVNNWQLDGAYIDGWPVTPQRAHVFGQAREDDAEARLHCAFNMVKGDRGAPADRRVTGAPTVNEASFTFSPGDSIHGLERETQAWTWLFFARSTDTDVGQTSSDRAPVMGNFRQGLSIYLGSSVYGLTNSAFRAQTYDAAGGLVTTVLNIPAAGLDRWRLIEVSRYLDGATWKLRIVNHTGDSEGLSGGNTPTPASLAAAPGIGRFPLAFGYPGEIWTKHMDVQNGVIFPEALSGGDLTAAVAKVRALFAQSGLTEAAA